MSAVAKHPLEWVVFALSLVLVLGIVGYLTWDAIQGEGTPAELAVEVGKPEPRQGSWAVPVIVRNRGEETAEEVRVEVTLEIHGAPRETADFDVAFVPRQSYREGWVTFEADPSRGMLTGRAIGYQRP